jgi:3-oxoacyl-[acyl-carrier-protein] synthase II
MIRRAVITGLGTVNPLAQNIYSFWKRLTEGENGIGPLTRFDASAFKVRFGGEVRDFAPEERLGAREAKRLDRFAQLGMIAAMDAVTDSGIDFSHEDPFRCGVALGSGIGGMSVFEEESEKYHRVGPSRVSPFLIPKMMANAATASISIQYGLRGPATCVTSACASAGDAIASAVDAIRLGRVDVMVSGGTEAALTSLGLAGFCSARALSERNDQPEAACRPFDKDRDGFVLGEGAGIVILEEYEHARRRGANIYCEVQGYGQTADAHHITAPHPEGEGASRAIQMALQDARIDPEDVDYINTHATGTQLGDKAETRAIHTALGAHARRLVVSSTKSMIGHLCGASGGIAAIVCALTLRDSIVHPTINYETPDPECDLDCIPNTARQLPIRRAMSTSFGFGGHNCCLVLGKV